MSAWGKKTRRLATREWQKAIRSPFESELDLAGGTTHLSGGKSMSSLKNTFNKNAAEYRRYRPTYPSALAGDICRLAALKSEAHILEIGCGAGQATCLFNGLHPRQTSIDIGANLIEECVAQFGSFSNYSFICSSFEDFEEPSEGYDLIYAATCFHWLEPGLRFSKSSTLLKPGGHLAVFTDSHCKNRNGFFAEVQHCYKEYAPELVPNANGSPMERNVEEQNPLRWIASREYDRELKYTADEYVGLLKTFSGHIALGDERLGLLCNSIHQLICNRYEGIVLKTLTTKLRLYAKAEQVAEPGAFGPTPINEAPP